MRARPISPPALVELLTDKITALAAEGWIRVALDGPPVAQPQRWAEQLIEPLRVRARPAIHISADDFLRPASVRFELGRTNPDAFYETWFDLSGLRREVLDRLEPSGPGTVLPTLWNPVTDRATRDGYVELPLGGVLLVSGALLLGAGLPFELEVHFDVSPAALARRTAPDLAWTLPAYARYAEEVDPATLAGVAVRLDDPRHPALLQR